MKYYKLDNYLFAIGEDKINPCTYMCRITPLGEHLAQVCTGKAAEHQMIVVETRKSKVKITEDEFQESFSKAVELLSNDTPYA